jgi:hypothetical protein
MSRRSQIAPDFLPSVSRRIHRERWIAFALGLVLAWPLYEVGLRIANSWSDFSGTGTQYQTPILDSLIDCFQTSSTSCRIEFYRILLSTSWNPTWVIGVSLLLAVGGSLLLLRHQLHR